MKNSFLSKSTLIAFLAIFLTNTPTYSSQPTWLLRPSDTLNKYPNICKGYIAALASELQFFIPTTFFKNTPENILFKLSEIKAKRVFWDAYNTVPAYRDFVEKRCNKTSPKSFSTIPLISKATYIEQYPIEQTLRNGSIPEEGFMDPSSGTSGRRTLWIRGKNEIKKAQKIMNLVRSMFLEDEKYVLINMFLPSAWSLGLMRGLGPNVPEAYETLKDLGTKPKYLIMGHTSLIKFFVQHCPFDLTEFDITLLVAGEHMSRALHTYFLDRGIKKVLSGYGASDLHFTIGIQENFAQKLQELCWNNPELKKELTGNESGQPYFFQYNPLDDYIEEIDGRLVFTDLDHSRISPRVRYDVGDRGKILKMSFVKKVLNKYGIHLTPQTNLPLICLYGRVEHKVSFKNAELAFDDLELAILSIPELAQHMNQYAYNTYTTKQGNAQLEFWVELKSGVSIDQFDTAVIETKLMNGLSNLNPFFKKELAAAIDMKPILKLYEYGMSPMLEESVFRKAKFIYNVENS